MCCNRIIIKKDLHFLKLYVTVTVLIEIHMELQHTKLYGSIIRIFVLYRLVCRLFNTTLTWFVLIDRWLLGRAVDQAVSYIQASFCSSVSCFLWGPFNKDHSCFLKHTSFILNHYKCIPLQNRLPWTCLSVLPTTINENSFKTSKHLTKKIIHSLYWTVLVQQNSEHCHSVFDK
jgi:hypothetical protein